MNGSLLQLTSVQWNNIKWLRPDGGGEYTGRDFQNWITQRGNVHEATAAYASESNGDAERLNSTLLDMARTMSLGVDVPRSGL